MESRTLIRESPFYPHNYSNDSFRKEHFKMVYIPDFQNGIDGRETVIDMEIEPNTQIMDFLIKICSLYHLFPPSDFHVWAPTGVNGALEACKASAKISSLSMDAYNNKPVDFLKIIHRKTPNKMDSNGTIYTNNTNRYRYSVVGNSYDVCDNARNLTLAKGSKNNRYNLNGNCQSSQKFCMGNGVGNKDNSPTYLTKKEILPFQMTQRVLVNILPMALRKKYVVRASLDEPLRIIMDRVCSESAKFNPSQCRFVLPENNQGNLVIDAGLVDDVIYKTLDLELSMSQYRLSAELYLLPSPQAQASKTLPSHQNSLTLPSSNPYCPSIKGETLNKSLISQPLVSAKFRTMPNTSEKSNVIYDKILNHSKNTKQSNHQFDTLSSQKSFSNSSSSSITNASTPSSPSLSYSVNNKSDKNDTNNIGKTFSTDGDKIDGRNKNSGHYRRKAPLPPIPNDLEENKLDTVLSDDHRNFNNDGNYCILNPKSKQNYEHKNHATGKYLEDDDGSCTSSGYHGSSNSPSPLSSDLIKNEAINYEGTESRPAKSTKKKSAPKPPLIESSIKSSTHQNENIPDRYEPSNTNISLIGVSGTEINDENLVVDSLYDIIDENSIDQAGRCHFEDFQCVQPEFIKKEISFCDQEGVNNHCDNNLINYRESTYLETPSNHTENIYENLEDTLNSYDIMRGEENSSIMLEGSNLYANSMDNSNSSLINMNSFVSQAIYSEICRVNKSSNNQSDHQDYENNYEEFITAHDDEVFSERDIVFNKYEDGANEILSLGINHHEIPINNLESSKGNTNNIYQKQYTDDSLKQKEVKKNINGVDTEVQMRPKNSKPLNTIQDDSQAKYKETELKKRHTFFRFRTSDASEVVRKSRDEQHVTSFQNPCPNEAFANKGFKINGDSSQMALDRSINASIILNKKKERPWTLTTLFKSSNSTNNKYDINSSSININKPKCVLNSESYKVHRDNSSFNDNVTKSTNKMEDTTADLKQRAEEKCIENIVDYKTNGQIIFSTYAQNKEIDTSESPDMRDTKPTENNQLYKAQSITIFDNNDHPVNCETINRYTSFFKSPSFKSSLYSKFNSIQLSLTDSGSSSTSSSSDNAELNSSEYDNNKQNFFNGVNNDFKSIKVLKGFGNLPIVGTHQKGIQDLDLNPQDRDKLLIQIRTCGGKDMLKRTSTLKKDKFTIYQSTEKNI
ncbi:unnamed protein product [Gordionus sp. m RMFG-2023]